MTTNPAPQNPALDGLPPDGRHEPSWIEQRSFVRIFRSFRMAVQPGKILLALAGVVLMGVWGSLLDGLWLNRLNPLPGEIAAVSAGADEEAWRAQAVKARATVIAGLYDRVGFKPPADLNARAQSDADSLLNDFQDELVAGYDTRFKAAAAQPGGAAGVAEQHQRFYRQAEALKSRGIYRAFLEYEQETLAELLRAGRRLLWLDFGALTRGLGRSLDPRAVQGTMVYPEGEVGLEPGTAQFESRGDRGVLPLLIDMFRGVQWLITERFFFALLFLLGSLAIWALFGGAIARMAAMNVSCDEQIPPKAALRFATRKFLGFFTAPLLPLAMLALLGGGLILAGVVLVSIPYVGELLGGLLLILALAVGFVIALVLAGAVGGGSLLWPTVAVEGSDGFDAVSRSYSYFYSRPWRTAFYSLVALVYGAITYAVVRLFILVLLRATRGFLVLGTAGTERPGTGLPEATKIEAMWPLPTYQDLVTSPVPFGLQHWEPAGAWLIQLWTVLVVLLMCAFLVSFFLCASTVIYGLLRRKVDGVDIEDIYLEDGGEDAFALGAPASVEAPATSPSPADVRPPLGPTAGGAAGPTA